MVEQSTFRLTSISQTESPTANLKREIHFSVTQRDCHFSYGLGIRIMMDLTNYEIH